MTNQFKFILRTPDEELVNMEVDSVYLNSEVGEMMLLPGHASLSAAVTYSPVIVSVGSKKDEYLTSSGVLFFYNPKNEAYLLVQRGTLKDKVDYDGLKSYLKLVEEYLESGKDLSSIHMKFLEGEKIALVQSIESEKN